MGLRLGAVTSKEATALRRLGQSRTAWMRHLGLERKASIRRHAVEHQ